MIKPTFSFVTTLLALALTPVSGASFSQLSKHLDADGDFIAYMDFKGDWEVLGAELNAIYRAIATNNPQLAAIPIDFTVVLDHLGVSSLQSVGASSKSVDGTDLYANRRVVAFDGRPKGLLRMFGYDSEAGPFSAAASAPEDADTVVSFTLDLDALKGVVLDLANQVMGPLGAAIIQQQLGFVLPGTDVTVDEILRALSTGVEVVLAQDVSFGDQDGAQNNKARIRFAGAGALLPRLQPLGALFSVEFKETPEGVEGDFSSLISNTGLPGLFVRSVVNDGNALVIETNPDWTVVPGGKSLKDTEAFQNVARHLPENAIAFAYSGGFDWEPLWGNFEGLGVFGEYEAISKRLFDRFLGGFLKPAASATTFKDGVAVTHEFAHYSTKEAIMVVPSALIGGVAIAAGTGVVPYFQKGGIDKSEQRVTNNLRMIWASAQQHLLETGTTSVRAKDLMGPGKMLAAIESVAGESYDDLLIDEDAESLSVTLEDGRVVTYSPEF